MSGVGRSGAVVRFEAVLFDLFGTIVAPYERELHHAALAGAARALGVGFDVMLDGWEETWDDRATGRFASITDNLRSIVPGASDTELAEADRVYEDFTFETLAPKPFALEVLDWLAGLDVATALVTNCAPDVPEMWSRTPWAGRFEATVFSCVIGVKKPDPLIYRAALDALGVEPEQAAFVGDGSDRELPGAAAIGLSPVLVRNDSPSAGPGDAAGVTEEGWPSLTHLGQLPAALARM